jgi:VIT1/CCC1 family predicted Fe2+/Mn2+ transporter
MSEESNPETGAGADVEKEAYRTKRVSEFVYGVISAMIAIAGLVEGSYGGSGRNAAAVVITGAAAIWLAHSYAEWLGEHVRAKGENGFIGVFHAARASWPIVIAGFIIAAPAAFSESGAWSVSRGLWLGTMIGLAMLFVLGLVAARLSQLSAIRTAGMTLLTVGIGVAVVAVERAVHHIW